MPNSLSVHLLPALVMPGVLHGGIAVIIDVLRASTTIAHALAAGAHAVVPCLNIDEAKAAAARHPGRAVLGGERLCLLIEGFDLDNSPLRYTPDSVGGTTVFFTTTNGTRALRSATDAERIYIGAFSNINALLDRLVEADGPIHLLCAGTEGHITLEDVLFAGALATGLAAAWQRETSTFNDQTQLACTLFASCRDRAADFDHVLRGSRGGRNLVAHGLEADIERAAQWDLFTHVPEFDRRTGSIVHAGPVQAPGDGRPINKTWLHPPR